MTGQRFRFGLEGEYLLVEQETYRPLWLPDLSFQRLNGLLEGIAFEPLLDGLTLDGLELDPPHRRLTPHYVEGYPLPDSTLRIQSRKGWGSSPPSRTPFPAAGRRNPRSAASF
jgi:hypothetical protein